MSLMIPVGYMAKKVVVGPQWMKAPDVTDVYSLSSCVSRDFAHYIDYWKHNGYWLFDSPGVIVELAREHSLDLTGTTLFYYEVHDLQFEQTTGQWTCFGPEAAFKTSVVPPTKKFLEGFDVVTFYCRTSPECSPLSCNGLASTVRTNRHCLLTSLERGSAAVGTEEIRRHGTRPVPHICGLFNDMGLTGGIVLANTFEVFGGLNVAATDRGSRVQASRCLVGRPLAGSALSVLCACFERCRCGLKEFARILGVRVGLRSVVGTGSVVLPTEHCTDIASNIMPLNPLLHRPLTCG